MAVKIIITVHTVSHKNFSPNSFNYFKRSSEFKELRDVLEIFPIPFSVEIPAKKKKEEYFFILHRQSTES